jgi:hypothetical protein
MVQAWLASKGPRVPNFVPLEAIVEADAYGIMDELVDRGGRG